VSFIENLWQIFLEAAPYLMVGFVVAGILHQYLPAQFVQKHLGGSSWGNIFKASLIGTPVPLCSCGVVPVGLGLHRDGASKPTVISFLISTPENGVESISLTYSFFGLPLTIIRIVFAIVVANLTALTVALFEKRTDQPNSEKSVSCCSSESAPLKSCCDPAPVVSDSSCCGSPVETPVNSCCTPTPAKPSNSCCGSEPKAGSERPNGFQFVVDDFVPSIARWLLIGFLISAVITTFLPADLLTQLDPKWAVPLAGLIGIPMYVCASASTPIAFSLFVSGLSPGACLVFLLTGPATNSANFPVYLKEFGRRVTGLYYGGIYFFSVALGLLLDAVLRNPLLLDMPEGGHHHFHPSFLHYAGAVALIILLVNGLTKESRSHGGSCC